MGRGSVLLAACGVLLAASAAWGQADPVAVLTELQLKRGQAHVRAVGDTAWSAPKPLQALRAGDQVRVVGEGRAILVFTGGKMEIVTQTNSPYSVPAQAPEGVSEKLRSVLGGVTGFLMGQPRERQYQSLSVRSVRLPPVILAPRETKVMPDAVAFEWSGPERARYTVRLLNAAGALVWQQGDLPKQPLGYPTGAPALPPGRYTWELIPSDGQPPQRAAFDVVAGAEADSLREELGTLQTAARTAGYTPGTVGLLRAGLMFQKGLLADARRELLAAIKASPDEAALHQLLGHVYDRMGLRNLAADAFDEADALTKPN
jgi:hypothetical protein